VSVSHPEHVEGFRQLAKISVVPVTAKRCLEMLDRALHVTGKQVMKARNVFH